VSSTIRKLERGELSDIWTIDRSEVIERVYHYENGRLALRDEHYDLQGWPPDEVDRDAASLLDCFDHGGSFFGAFSDHGLVGACTLESRFIGELKDQLQLKFLHVSQRYRGSGLGRRLFAEAVDKARSLGARTLYVSATPSENTIRFYRSVGCRLADELDPSLFALEPEDIHLTLPL
jgi:predicted N-acetyltransferase YhbS